MAYDTGTTTRFEFEKETGWDERPRNDLFGFLASRVEAVTRAPDFFFWGVAHGA